MPNKNGIFFLERVSKPAITWECSNTTLTCEVKEGTDLELKLYRGKRLLASGHQKIIGHKWTTLSGPFKCNAKNKVSEEFVTAVVSCSGTAGAEVRVAQVHRGGLLGLGRCDRCHLGCTVLGAGGQRGSGWEVKRHLFLLETFWGGGLLATRFGSPSTGVTWLRAGKEAPLEGSIAGLRRETLAGGNPTCARCLCELVTGILTSL